MQKNPQHASLDLRQRNFFPDLGRPYLKMMAATIQEIHDVCAVRKMSHVTVTSFEDDPSRNFLARNEVIEFLIGKKIIEVCHQKHGKSYSRWDIKVVDQDALVECVKQLRAAMKSTTQQMTLSPSKDAKNKSSGAIIECPPETKWGDIEIRFVNGETILVKVEQLRKRYSYTDLGFVDGRSTGPNKQWKFLEALSESRGNMSWDDPNASKKWKKQKSLLSKTLRDCFGINDDPFFPYRDRGIKGFGAYRLKLKKIIPH